MRRKRKNGRIRQAVLLGAAFAVLTAGTAFAMGSETSPYGAGALKTETLYPGIYDLADLLYEEEERELSNLAAALKERMAMDVAVVTTEENLYSAQEYADWFYIDNELGVGEEYDGALFLVDMDNREMWISTFGKMNRYITDSRREAIFDDTYSYISQEDYYSTALAFLEDVEICYENGITKDQYNEDVNTGEISRYRSLAWYEILIALLAAAASGFVAVNAVVKEYGMKKGTEQIAANFKLSYRKDSAFTLGNILADVLLGSYVTQQIIASARNNRPRGGRGGGFSGGGRTSVHRTGGRSIGGGGRKF